MEFSITNGDHPLVLDQPTPLSSNPIRSPSYLRSWWGPSLSAGSAGTPQAPHLLRRLERLFFPSLLAALGARGRTAAGPAPARASEAKKDRCLKNMPAIKMVNWERWTELDLPHRYIYIYIYLLYWTILRIYIYMHRQRERIGETETKRSIQLKSSCQRGSNTCRTSISESTHRTHFPVPLDDCLPSLDKRSPFDQSFDK